jgi:curved DNA-binding protein CbpA
MNPNYYEILEIPSDADEREIKNAYHRLARELHPDKAPTPEDAKGLEDRFAQVSAAYNTLKDPAKRAEHDKRAQGVGGQKAPGQPSGGSRKTATASVLSAGRKIPTPSVAGGPGTSRPPLGLTPEKVGIAQKAFARGMRFFKDAHYAKAIEFFEAAIQNNDTEGVYHARLSLALIQAKKSATRAIDAAQRAIDLEPYNLDYKVNLAFIFEMIGSKTNAKKIYEEILRWDAGDTRATAALEALRKNKSSFTLRSGKAGEKAGFLEKLIRRFRK